MKGLELSRSRLAQLAVLGLLVLFSLLLMPAARPAQAAECDYTVFDDCFDLATPRFLVLQRYFVIEYHEDCTRIYDVLVGAYDRNAFTQVVKPVRSSAPNLQQYNRLAVTLPKAQGEINETDLQQAIANGDVVEFSRTLIDERCGAGEVPESRPDKCDLLPTPPEPPWQLMPIDEKPLMYAHLLQLPEGCESSIHPAIQLPEGSYATFLVVNTEEIEHVLRLLQAD